MAMQLITCRWADGEETTERVHNDYVCDCVKLAVMCGCTIRIGVMILERQPDGVFKEIGRDFSYLDS
jgi:hypothetical protein